MKSFLLAAKIATVFLLVMGTFVFVTLHLFSQTVTFNFPAGVNPTEAHNGFVVAVLWLSLVAMILLIALSVYVTNAVAAYESIDGSGCCRGPGAQGGRPRARRRGGDGTQFQRHGRTGP